MSGQGSKATRSLLPKMIPWVEKRRTMNHSKGEYIIQKHMCFLRVFKATRSSLLKMIPKVEMRRTLYQNIMEDSRNEVGLFRVMLLKCHTNKQK